MAPDTPISKLSLDLNRDVFLRTLLRELATVLEDVVGYEEVTGFISLVGQNVGDWLNELYKKELRVERLSLEQVAAVLVDLKTRIHGEFALVSQDEEKLVLQNKVCPFAEKVLDRPSLCMMTSNVFGVIAAENLGYAKVVLEKTLAKRDECCRVTVYLKNTPDAEAARGREYFRSSK